MNNFYSLWTG